MNSTTIELRPIAPYAFSLALSYLESSPSSVLESVDPERGHYERALRLDGVDLLLTVQSNGTLEAPRLAVNIHGANANPELVDAVRRHVSHIFLLDVDPAPFLRVASRDAVLGSIVGDHPGLRPLLVADAYEALVFAIVGQQVNIAFARKMKLALIEQYGQRETIAGREVLLLPTPERIAALDPVELRQIQFSRQKADYIVGLSREIAEGRLKLDALSDLPLEAAISELTQHRGIGRWTAEYVLMRGLGRSRQPSGWGSRTAQDHWICLWAQSHGQRSRSAPDR